MSLKSWAFDKFFKESAIHEAYRKFDDFMIARFPFSWRAFLSSLKGWKTITGLVLIGLAPALTSWAQLLMSAGATEVAGHVIFWGAWALFIIGVLHKIVKFVLYEEAIDKDGFLDEVDPEKPSWPYDDSGLGPKPKR